MSAYGSSTSCNQCHFLAYRIGKLEAENEDLKQEVSRLTELLRFYELLNVHETDIGGIYFKEACYGTSQKVTVPKTDKAAA